MQLVKVGGIPYRSLGIENHLLGEVYRIPKSLIFLHRLFCLYFKRIIWDNQQKLVFAENPPSAGFPAY